MSDEEAYERMKEEVLDDDENKRIIYDELIANYAFPSESELLHFLSDVNDDYRDYVDNDPSVNFKMLNLNEPSEIFDQSQSMYYNKSQNMNVDQSPSKYEVPYDYISESQNLEALVDSHSTLMWQDENYARYKQNCPICFAILSLVDNFIWCESEDCIEIEVPWEVDLKAFSYKMLEAINDHKNCHDGLQTELKLDIYQDNEDGINAFTLVCKDWDEIMFIEA